MTNFVAVLVFISTGWTSKFLYMWGITTLAASVLPCVLRNKSSLFLWFSWFLIIKIVGFLPKLEDFIFLLGLTGWYLCAVMWQEINLYHLWVPCNYAVAWELSIIFAHWCTVLAGNLLNSTWPSFKVLERNDSSLRKNQNIYLCRIWAVSWGSLASVTCACTALYHSLTLISPCLKVISKSNLALTSLACGLQNSSNFFHMTSKVKSSLDKFQDMYWFKLKSPLQTTISLHFLASGSIAISHSNIFSHLILHLRNLLYNPSFMVQSIVGPSMYGIYILGITCAFLLVDGWGVEKHFLIWACLFLFTYFFWKDLFNGVLFTLGTFWSFWHLDTIHKLMQAIQWLDKLWLLKYIFLHVRNLWNSGIFILQASSTYFYL